jgi:hypothetical protein
MSLAITDQLPTDHRSARHYHRRNTHQPRSLPTQEATHARPSWIPRPPAASPPRRYADS